MVIDAEEEYEEIARAILPIGKWLEEVEQYQLAAIPLAATHRMRRMQANDSTS